MLANARGFANEMESKLAGRVAIVTGGASGIGEATVHALARHIADQTGERVSRRPGHARGAMRRQILRGRQIVG